MLEHIRQHRVQYLMMAVMSGVSWILFLLAYTFWGIGAALGALALIALLNILDELTRAVSNQTRFLTTVGRTPFDRVIAVGALTLLVFRGPEVMLQFVLTGTVTVFALGGIWAGYEAPRWGLRGMDRFLLLSMGRMLGIMVPVGAYLMASRPWILPAILRLFGR